MSEALAGFTKRSMAMMPDKSSLSGLGGLLNLGGLGNLGEVFENMRGKKSIMQTVVVALVRYLHDVLHKQVLEGEEDEGGVNIKSSFLKAARDQLVDSIQRTKV